MNGDFDVALPPDTRGMVRMKPDRGEIYSDFDVKLDSRASAPAVRTVVRNIQRQYLYPEQEVSRLPER